MRMVQIVGIIIALVVGAYGFWKRKHRRYSRLQAYITCGLAAGLLILALFPSSSDLLAAPLMIERWNAVLFTATLVLFGLFLFIQNQNNETRHTLSRLIEALAATQVDEQYPDGIDCDVLVIIPAYNEADNLGTVLRKMPKEVSGWSVKCLVADDGSVDHTARVASQNGAIVISNPINRGGGAVLRAGYRVALTRSNAKIVMTLDADGQHLPEEIPTVLQPVIEDRADLVNGSRVLGTHQAESQIRVAGVFLFNKLISFLMNKRITDSSNAFRAIRVELLRKITLKQNQFHTSELLIEAIKSGARVVEVPITILRRQSGTTKKPRSLRYGWGYTRAILQAWLR